MAIIASDIVFRLSGGAANASQTASLGGARSTAGGAAIITTDTINNVWSDVSGAEGAAGSVKYRCIYVLNNHGSLTYTAPKIWISANTTSADDEIDIAIGSSAVNGVEQTIANEDTAPTGGVTFTHPTTFAGGLALSDLPFGQHRAIWIKRTVNAAAAAANANPYTLSVQGETAA
jgi:hypothetical protein